ncbi:MAG: esterase/lipase family protein [Acidiferrobacterales bacterium]
MHGTDTAIAWHKTKRLLTIGLSLALVACAATPKQPDLKRLYAVSAADRSQKPVILVHGMLASKLRSTDDGREIWPGPLTNFIFNRLNSLALEIDPESLRPEKGDSEAYALFGRRHYDQIRKALNAGGYSLGQVGQSISGNAQNFYVFIYDWRQDMAEIAGKLDRFIDQIRRDYNDPNLKVDIVAHSMGALVTRYYLRYGGEDVLASDAFRPNHVGAAKTRKVILLGAPNMGSISGLQTFMKGAKFGPARLYPEVVATMPGAYQLLPHPDRNWMITLDGRKWERDLYSVQTWRNHQWSIFDPKARKRITKRFSTEADAARYIDVLERFFEKNLVRGKRFHRALSISLKQTPVRYIVFGGDCVLTPARCALEQVNGHIRIRFHPSEIINRVSGVDYDKLMLEPGDGRVTKPSLLARNSLDPSAPTNNDGAFPIAYVVFLCESHSRLTGNITFQDNLLNILLAQETTEDRMNRGEVPLLKRPRVRSAIPDSADPLATDH